MRPCSLGFGKVDRSKVGTYDGISRWTPRIENSAFHLFLETTPCLDLVRRDHNKYLKQKNEKEEYDTTEFISSYPTMALEQQQLTFDFDSTKDYHLPKRPKLNEDDLLEDDDDQENNAADAAVDFALQMLARDQRRVDSL